MIPLSIYFGLLFIGLTIFSLKRRAEKIRDEQDEAVEKAKNIIAGVE